MKIDDGLPSLVGDHPMLGDLARQVAHRRIIGRTAHLGHVPLVQVGQQHVIPVKQGVQVDRDDSPCVQSPERREVIGHVQQGFLAPSTAVVPPALGTSGELGVEVGPLRLVQSGFGAKGGVKVLDIAFRARGRVDRDVVSVDRMVLARVRGRDRDGSVDSPPLEFGLRSPARWEFQPRPLLDTHDLARLTSKIGKARSSTEVLPVTWTYELTIYPHTP
jgi:hypothetical protein